MTRSSLDNILKPKYNNRASGENPGTKGLKALNTQSNTNLTTSANKIAAETNHS